MRKKLIRIYKDVMLHIDDLDYLDFIDIKTDVYSLEYFLDLDCNSALITFSNLIQIDFQNKRQLNNLLGNKRIHYTSILEYFNNFKKEVNYGELNNNFKKFINMNILGIEYLIINVDKLCGKDRMLVYYILSNLEILYTITTGVINWKTKELIKELLQK